ncbi:hypothetical protein F5884DRAFT_754944 [Xylogone sp. PMI_703]|nr:hypothetical protein F5884DRAFT_754944 [Xylogone sp. PMI_703]
MTTISPIDSEDLSSDTNHTFERISTPPLLIPDHTVSGKRASSASRNQVDASPGKKPGHDKDFDIPVELNKQLRQLSIEGPETKSRDSSVPAQHPKHRRTSSNSPKSSYPLHPDDVFYDSAVEDVTKRYKKISLGGNEAINPDLRTESVTSSTSNLTAESRLNHLNQGYSPTVADYEHEERGSPLSHKGKSEKL